MFHIYIHVEKLFTKVRMTFAFSFSNRHLFPKIHFSSVNCLTLFLFRLQLLGKTRKFSLCMLETLYTDQAHVEGKNLGKPSKQKL